MRVEIISVGTELLLGQIVDTNAAWLSARLAEIGVSVYRRVTVGDNLERLVDALQDALRRAEGVITIGGLGPTEDDLTREAIAQVLGEPLRLWRRTSASCSLSADAKPRPSSCVRRCAHPPHVLFPTPTAPRPDCTPKRTDNSFWLCLVPPTSSSLWCNSMCFLCWQGIQEGR